MPWLRKIYTSDLSQLINRRYLPIIVSFIIVYSLNSLYKGRTGSGDRLIGPSTDALYYSTMTLFADHRENIKILIPTLYANRFLMPILLNKFLPEDKVLYKDGKSQLTWFGVSKDPFQNPIPKLDLIVANKVMDAFEMSHKIALFFQLLAIYLILRYYQVQRLHCYFIMLLHGLCYLTYRLYLHTPAMVDPEATAFYLWGVYFIVTRNHLGTFLTIVMGSFVRENLLFLLPFYLCYEISHAETRFTALPILVSFACICALMFSRLNPLFSNQGYFVDMFHPGNDTIVSAPSSLVNRLFYDYITLIKVNGKRLLTLKGSLSFGLVFFNVFGALFIIMLLRIRTVYRFVRNHFAWFILILSTQAIAMHIDRYIYLHLPVVIVLSGIALRQGHFSTCFLIASVISHFICMRAYESIDWNMFAQTYGYMQTEYMTVGQLVATYKMYFLLFMTLFIIDKGTTLRRCLTTASVRHKHGSE